MALTRSDETDILASLHAGPLEDAPWQTFLERLRKRLGADRCGLMIEPPGAPLQEWFAGSAAPTLAQRRLIELFGPADPLRLRQMRAERVYGLGDLVDPGDPAQAAVVRDLLMPAGENHMRILRVSEPGGAVAWLRAARAGADFGAAAASILSSMAPHLAIALRSHAWAARVRQRAALSERMERLAGLGWIAFDVGGPVLDLSAGARHLLARMGGMRPVPGDRLALPDPAASRALAEAIDRAAMGGEATAMPLASDPRVELRLRPVEGDGPAHGAAVLGILRSGDGLDAEATVQPLMQLYGLSRSEARLAAHLAAGATLAGAAAAMGLTIETARNYSKRVFEKTGTRGQADLIRLVLTGVAPLS